MLEHSSAAMAEDILTKSKLIQHYCMEGKSGQICDVIGKEQWVEESVSYRIVPCIRYPFAHLYLL